MFLFFVFLKGNLTNVLRITASLQSCTFNFCIRLDTNSISCDGCDPSTKFRPRALPLNRSSNDLDFFSEPTKSARRLGPTIVAVVALAVILLVVHGTIILLPFISNSPSQDVSISVITRPPPAPALICDGGVGSHKNIPDVVAVVISSAATFSIKIGSMPFSLFVRERSGMKYGRIRNEVSCNFRGLFEIFDRGHKICDWSEFFIQKMFYWHTFEM